jgi:hypothetical protein
MVSAEAFLEAEGYRRCDIAACNCGSWHRRVARESLGDIASSLLMEMSDGDGQHSEELDRALILKHLRRARRL